MMKKFQIRILSIFLLLTIIFIATPVWANSYQTIDLDGVANRNVFNNPFGDRAGNMNDFPIGDKTIDGIPFKLKENIIILNGGFTGYGRIDNWKSPAQVNIPVNIFTEEMYFINASGWTVNSEIVGSYKINYSDGSTEVIELKPGKNIEEISGDKVYAPQLILAFLVNRNTSTYHFGLFKYNVSKPTVKIISVDFIDSGTSPAPILAALTVKVAQPDSLAPVTTVNLSGTEGENSWYTSDVQVTLTATDNQNGSGIAKTEYSFDDINWITYTIPFCITKEGQPTLYYRSIDKANNSEITKNLIVNIDKTVPTTTITLDGTQGNNGWYTSDVKVTMIATDTGGSGVDKTEYSFDGTYWTTYNEPFTISAEGATALYYRSIDKAGNIEAVVQEEKINVDVSAPTTNANFEGPSGSGAWSDSGGQVSLNVEDAGGSGEAQTEYSYDGETWLPYQSPINIDTEGTINLYYRTVDKAGNAEEPKMIVIKIDKTPPEVNIILPADGAEYFLGETILADWTASDGLSGLASATGTGPSGAPIDTSSVGLKTFTVTAIDNAGIFTTKTMTYRIIYTLESLDLKDGKVHKLGSTIPVKFQLKDAEGRFVTNAAAKLFMAKVKNGTAGEEVEAVSTSKASTGNLFRYDSTENQYIFNLATKELSTGSWQLKILLDDVTAKFVEITLK